MNITGKYVKDGVLLGFEITEENTYSAPPMSLYLEPYMQILTEKGYAYYDYEPSHITLPNGQSIMTVPDKEYTDEVRTEIALAKRSFSNILSDAQACKYYTQKVDRGPAIEFVKYQGPFEVNTREELAAYIDRVENALSKNPCSILIRPLNTVVNPDVWFTPEEIITAQDSLYQRLLSIRKWANYEHYMLTCDFLAEQGAIQKGDYSLRALMQGWYAFGPDLIKGKYVDSGFALNAVGNFYSNDKIVGSESCSENSIHRNFTIGAYNTRRGTLHAATGEFVDADANLSLDRGKRQPVWVHDKQLNTLKMTESEYEVVIVPSVGAEDATDRFFCAVEYEGRVYDTRYDICRSLVGYGQRQRRNMGTPMLIGTAIRGDYISIGRIRSMVDYKKYLMAQLYSIVYSQRMVVEPVGFSNVEYLEKINMGFIGRVNKFCKLKDENSFRLDMIRDWDAVDLLSEAISYYIRPIPAYILDTFGIEEADSKESFLAQVDIDEYISKLVDAASPEGEEVPTYISPDRYKTKADRLTQILKLQQLGYEHEPYNYYCFIKIVSDIIHGHNTYGCLEEGVRLDSAVKVDAATNAILAVVNAVKGYECSIEEFSNAVCNLDMYVDLKTIYRPRDAAAVGFVRDFARDIEHMYNEFTPYWTYVSRVYRELSNKPVEQQRPYLLEIIAFSAADKQDKLLRDLFIKVAEASLEGRSIVPDYDYEKQFAFENNVITNAEKLTKSFAGYIGANLLFKCLVGVKTGKVDVNQNYVETFEMVPGCPIAITVPTFVLQKLPGIDIDAHRKYITLEQYCTLETDANDEFARSRLVCVNAAITPWSVTPLRGFSIKSYPLLQNYYDKETLSNSFGEEKTTALVTTKVKVADCLRSTCSNTDVFICPLTGAAKDDANLELHDMVSKQATQYEDLDCLLSEMFAETVDDYVKRWTLAKAAATNMGKALVSIPLKQDILYGEIGASFGYDVITAPVYSDDMSIRANFLSEAVLPLAGGETYAKIEKSTDLVFAPLSVENVDVNIASNITVLSDLPILPAVEYMGVVLSDTGRVTKEWIKEHFVKIGDTKWIGRLQTGYYVLEEV